MALGQQALLPDVESAGAFVCRKCGEEDSVREVGKVSQTAGIYVQRETDKADGESGSLGYMYDGMGSETYDDTFEVTGFDCRNCGAEADTLDELVEWRVEVDE